MLRYFPLMPGGDLCQWRTVDNLKWNSRWVFLCARQFIISLVIYDKMLHGSTIETAVFLTGPFITNDSPEFKSIFEHIADSHIQLSTCLSCYNTHCGIPYCQIWEKRTKKKKKASVLLWCSLLICVSSSVLDFSFILTWMGWIFFYFKICNVRLVITECHYIHSQEMLTRGAYLVHDSVSTWFKNLNFSMVFYFWLNSLLETV